jgi:outer membrane protein
MNFKTISTTLAVSLFCAISVITTDEARAQEPYRMQDPGFIWGFGLGIVEQVYNGFDQRVIPLPVIGYNGERLKVFGPFVRYEFLQMDKTTVSLQTAPRFNGYEELDSSIFDGMEKRKDSLDIGLGFKREVDRWIFDVSGMYDALGRSDGFELKGSIARVYPAGSFFIAPSLGLSYLDSNNVDYYFGVRDSEATAFRSAYKGEEALNTTAGISFITPAFFNGQTRLTISHTWFDSSIADSPLTDKDTTLGIILAFAHSF